jgi:hypothetical protein
VSENTLTLSQTQTHTAAGAEEFRDCQGLLVASCTAQGVMIFKFYLRDTIDDDSLLLIASSSSKCSRIYS